MNAHQLRIPLLILASLAQAHAVYASAYDLPIENIPLDGPAIRGLQNLQGVAPIREITVTIKPGKQPNQALATVIVNHSDGLGMAYIVNAIGEYNRLIGKLDLRVPFRTQNTWLDPILSEAQRLEVQLTESDGLIGMAAIYDVKGREITTVDLPDEDLTAFQISASEGSIYQLLSEPNGSAATQLKERNFEYVEIPRLHLWHKMPRGRQLKNFAKERLEWITGPGTQIPDLPDSHVTFYVRDRDSDEILEVNCLYEHTGGINSLTNCEVEGEDEAFNLGTVEKRHLNQWFFN